MTTSTTAARHTLKTAMPWSPPADPVDLFTLPAPEAPQTAQADRLVTLASAAATEAPTRPQKAVADAKLDIGPLGATLRDEAPGLVGELPAKVGAEEVLRLAALDPGLHGEEPEVRQEAGVHVAGQGVLRDRKVGLEEKEAVGAGPRSRPAP